VILVDSNILIDLFSHDRKWVEWSKDRLAECDANDRMAINQIVVAEVAPQFAQLQSFLDWIATFNLGLLEFDSEAAYCGGAAFNDYRQRRKVSLESAKSIIADFLIGGHAEVLGATILTRDPRFYRTYFPTVPLITPDKAEP
jgi:predicted nucleic acid-binding protein